MAAPMGFGDYLKAAFLQHWNLLYLFTAAGLTLLTPGHRDVVMALGMAGEVALLAAMVGNDRFRRHVNSQVGAQDDARLTDEMAARFRVLYSGLSKESKDSFDTLKRRCESMQGITDLDTSDSSSEGLDRIVASQLDGVNRLLWVYLKLLHTQAALTTFLKSTDEHEINSLEEAAKTKLRDMPDSENDALDQKKRKSLEDTLATALARKDNIKRAKENLEYVQLELARIFSKVNALAEMAVTRHDPSMITSEVDDAASSVESTEQAMGELRMFNGLTSEDTRAPKILSGPAVRVRG